MPARVTGCTHSEWPLDTEREDTGSESCGRPYGCSCRCCMGEARPLLGALQPLMLVLGEVGNMSMIIWKRADLATEENQSVARCCSQKVSTGGADEGS